MAVTDGQRWKLCAYQLNQTALHLDETLASDENPMKKCNNLIWHEPEDELFYEKDGSFEINLDLLGKIVGFYANEPNLEYRPVAGRLMDVKNDYNRNYFHNAHR